MKSKIYRQHTHPQRPLNVVSYILHEQEKRRAYEQHVLDIEHGSFTQLFHNQWVSLQWKPRSQGHTRLSIALSTENWGELGIFSHVSLKNSSEQTGCVSRIVQPTTHSTLGVYNSRLPLARYVW